MPSAFSNLYDSLATRKGEAQAIGPYAGGNGRIDRAVDLLSTAFPQVSGVLVDVGGATGNLGYALKMKFSERYTLDIAEDCRVPAEKKGNIFIHANTDENGIPMETSAVDCIVALDFIEHIIDPEKFARECMRILKPGGLVLINTPNIQFWRHLHSLVVEGVFPHTSGDTEVYHGGHLSFFNFHDMERIFGNFVDGRMEILGLTPDPPPPIWLTISKVPKLQLMYSDLIYTCRKP